MQLCQATKVEAAIWVVLWCIFMGSASTLLLYKPLMMTRRGVVPVDMQTMRQFMKSRNVAMLMITKEECPACQQMKPMYQLAGDTVHMTYGVPLFAIADTDETPQFNDIFQIQFVPSLFIYRGSTWQALSEEHFSKMMTSPWGIIDAFEEEIEDWRNNEGYFSTGLVAEGAHRAPSGVVTLLNELIWHFSHPSILLFLVIMTAVQLTRFVHPHFMGWLQQITASSASTRAVECLGAKLKRSPYFRSVSLV